VLERIEPQQRDVPNAAVDQHLLLLIRGVQHPDRLLQSLEALAKAGEHAAQRLTHLDWAGRLLGATTGPSHDREQDREHRQADRDEGDQGEGAVG
jgi:hypothetical protein